MTPGFALLIPGYILAARSFVGANLFARIDRMSRRGRMNSALRKTAIGGSRKGTTCNCATSAALF